MNILILASVLMVVAVHGTRFNMEETVPERTIENILRILDEGDAKFRERVQRYLARLERNIVEREQKLIADPKPIDSLESLHLEHDQIQFNYFRNFVRLHGLL